MGDFRTSKEAHPKSWHPDYGWQLLRRSSSYREAVEEFVSTAKKAADIYSIQAFEFLSLDAKRDRRSHRIKMRKDRNAFLSSRKPPLLDLYDLPGRPRRLDKSGTRIKFDAASKHYQRFLSWFGDIIRFPIDPDTDLPYHDSLQAVWALRPVTSASLSFLEKLDISEHQLGAYSHDANERVSYHLLVINENFKKGKIKKELVQYVDEYFSERAEPMRMARPHWEDEEFRTYLAVYDLFQSLGDTSRNRKYLEIGARLSPYSFERRMKRPKDSIRWARNQVSFVFKKLMPFFERKRPDRCKNRLA